MTVHIGIDPGLKGGIVVLGDAGPAPLYIPMPVARAGTGGKETLDMPAIVHILARYHDAVVALEEPGSRPGQSAQSVMTSGRNHGRIEGALVTLARIRMGLRYDLVRPQAWQKALGIAGKDADPKARSIALCQRLLPAIDLTCHGRFKKPHDGIADAACLALYALRVLAGRGAEP